MRDIPGSVKDDPVLSAFIAACERPTAGDLIEWTRRYPDRAEDILEVAEVLLAGMASEPSPELATRTLRTAKLHLDRALATAHGPRSTASGVSRASSRKRDPDRG